MASNDKVWGGMRTKRDKLQFLEVGELQKNCSVRYIRVRLKLRRLMAMMR